MIRRLALTAGLTILGAIAFAPNANAEDVKVDFSGEVPSDCTFTIPVAGELALSADKTTLDSTTDPGFAGTTTVNCNGGTVTVAPPDPTGDTPTAGVTVSATVTNVANPAQTADSSGTNFTLNADNVDLSIDMQAVASIDELPAGSYTYEVSVTATPN
ncbi:MAG: hypothetical protein MJK14_17205 [Rivularia sp. ALOHA_DT_140]|nr:hypothetical protein [Rivularia sp. ALOHA_DT_140]